MAGVFANAHQDDVAMIVVLSAGVAAAFIGTITGYWRYATADDRTSDLGSGCLFGLLDFLAGCYLLRDIISIWRRMY